MIGLDQQQSLMIGAAGKLRPQQASCLHSIAVVINKADCMRIVL